MISLANMSDTVVNITQRIGSHKYFISISLIVLSSSSCDKCTDRNINRKKKQSVMNFGCIVKPTALTAYVPNVATIIVSIIPAKEIKSFLGLQAMQWRAFLIKSILFIFSPRFLIIIRRNVRNNFP